MPINADTIPANNKIEIALGACSFSTLSAAANLYWWIKAIPAPRIKQAKQKIKKLPKIIEYAAIRLATVLAIDAKTKPSLRPIILITLAANIVDIAIPTM